MPWQGTEAYRQLDNCLGQSNVEIFILCVYMSLWVCVCEWNVCGVQKSEQPDMMLGIELGSFGRGASSVTTEPSLQPSLAM